MIVTKKDLLFFFYKWDVLTYSDVENGKELPLEFTTLKDAENFIEIVVK